MRNFWMHDHRPRVRTLVLAGTAAALLLLWLLFDWNWFRRPLENYVSRTTQREFRVGDLDVDLGWRPVIQLRDVRFANAPWAHATAPMARIGQLSFSLSLRDLWDGELYVPHAALSRADLVFERAADGRRNWVLKAPERSAEPSRLRIGSLSVQEGRARYEDHGEPFEVDIAVDTVSPAQGGGTGVPQPPLAPTAGSSAASGSAPAAASAPASAAVAGSSTAPARPSYSTRYRFDGKYHDAGFRGEAWTGDILSFQESSIPFALKGNLQAGTTRLALEGTVADVVKLSAIDMRVHIEGQTLASLYPFLLLPLPASPPYSISGHLQQAGPRFSVDDLKGRIGKTDVTGRATYLQRETRPLLTAQLQSSLLNLGDLGPLIGVEAQKTRSANDVLTQKETGTRAQARSAERARAADGAAPDGAPAAGDGVLPRGRFDGDRMKAIDAEVDYAAARLLAPDALAVESMRFSLRLQDGVARLAPLEFGFAGGNIVSEVTVDAREPVLRTTLNSDFRNLQLGALFPTLPKAAQGVGTVGAQIRLTGTGNSVAEAAAVANGSVAAAVSRGQLSNLLDAMAGLNGGKVLTLLLGGDRDIAVNCGAASFQVRNGIGQSEFFAIDTAQTRIDGSGSFNLRNERLDLQITPQPKSPGILSLRTPLYVRGTFRHPDAGLEKGPLVARAAGAVVLGLVNPLAALLPLIESGPGTDVDCAALTSSVSGARAQAASRSDALPQGGSAAAKRVAPPVQRAQPQAPASAAARAPTSDR